MFVNLFTAASVLAMKLAAPMFFTMLAVDMAMGCIGRLMPQMNIMQSGLPVKSVLGILVLLGTIMLTGDAVKGGLEVNLGRVFDYFKTGTQANG